MCLIVQLAELLYTVQLANVETLQVPLSSTESYIVIYGRYIVSDIIWAILIGQQDTNVSAHV